MDTNLFDPDDLLRFNDQAAIFEKAFDPADQPTNVLIVDDDIDIHSVTKLALRNVRFKKRPLKLMSAYRCAEAFELLKKHSDIALLLLDVVMERLKTR